MDYHLEKPSLTRVSPVISIKEIEAYFLDSRLNYHTGKLKNNQLGSISTSKHSSLSQLKSESITRDNGLCSVIVTRIRSEREREG